MKNQNKQNQKVTFESKVVTNDHGETVVTWTAQGSEWAEILTARGNEALASAKENAREVIRLRIRYRNDVSTDWRLTWNGQAYYVQAVDRSMQRAGELWITAQGKEVL